VGITRAILKAMDRENHRLDQIENQPIEELQRLQFSVTATRKCHTRLRTAIDASPEIERLLTFHDTEDE
ncbi:MAG: MgtC/SapB family protein, partial [Silvibacterium sp.]